jgi:hypothetical protein
MTLDDTKAASVMATADRTADPGGPGHDARTRVTGSSPLRGSSPITRVASLNQTSRSTYIFR